MVKLIPAWLVLIEWNLVTVVLFEVLFELQHFVVGLQVFRVRRLVAVELLNPLSRLLVTLIPNSLSYRLVLREEVSPLPLEFQGVVELASSLWAFQVEPEH